MKRLISFWLSFCFIAIIAATSTAFAAPKSRPGGGGGTASTPLGIDISWPQCGKKLPNDPAFVIVGVNGGLATTTNNCLASQLAYAKNKATGVIASQDKIQLYVNTANPGGLGTESWPSSNIDPAGNPAPTPYGEVCGNGDTLACAFQYGWNRAVQDVNNRFAPAAAQAGISQVPADYIWWLDVETENTWKEGGTPFDYASNVAVLEGLTAYFNTLNIEVGLYSTGPQWNHITGNAVGEGSNLIGLKNWRPGGASLNTAKDACNALPLTTGGQIVLTQFISKNLDYNHSCV